jgi:hypothetical protein
MSQQIPIPTVHLLPILDAKLIGLLRSLTPEEWFSPTLASKWLVKDIAAHLLDGNVRTLSLSRDKLPLQPTSPINSYKELVDYLNELNAVWVKGSQRISPPLLIELLEITGRQYCEYMSTLDPFDDAIFSVAWAGETVSKNWFHIAREYTEKFHHQQQIRDAVNKPGLMTRELFYPFIDTFLQGLPHTYRNVTANVSTTIQVTITTAIGGDWFLTRQNDSWQLAKQAEYTPTASVSIDPDTAWKLFSKGMTPAQAMEKVQISGDSTLAEKALQMISVMA